MLNFKEVIGALKNYSPILVYDEDGREGETDIIIPACNVTPKDVYMLRNDAGGLICVAIHSNVAEVLQIPFMSEILKIASKKFPVLLGVLTVKSPYGDSPAFSLTVNHKNTYTGITDNDRALTIRELAHITQEALEPEIPKRLLKKRFEENFRSPGHVHILIGSNGLLTSRRGHTELSLTLAEMAGIMPVMVVCEMLDGTTGNALSKTTALQYAKEKGIPFIEGKEIIEMHAEYRKSLHTGMSHEI